MSLRTMAEGSSSGRGGVRRGARKTLQWRWQSFVLDEKSPGICFHRGLSCLYFFVCLIKTGNALKLLKKYLGSIWRSPGAQGKTFPAGTAGVRLEGEVYLPRLRCRLKINYKSAWLMIVNRLTLPALSLLAPFPTLILVIFIVDVLVKLCDICQVPINIRNYIFTDLRRHLCINECTFWARYCLNLLNSSFIIELSQFEYTWILAGNTLIDCPTLPLTIIPLTKRF